MANQDTSETIFASEVEINGTIKTSGPVTFNGKLDGDLDSGGDVTIGKTARIKGHLNVESVSVAGEVAGNISAKERVEMLASAKVTGDVRAKRLKVEEGVSFVGRSDVNPSGAPVSSAASPSSASSAASAMPPIPGEPGGAGRK